MDQCINNGSFHSRSTHAGEPGDVANTGKKTATVRFLRPTPHRLNITRRVHVYKLIDLKLLYCYEENTAAIFNFGPALIVGNDEIDKLNPATLGLLQQIHYRVYLLSILIETTLDLLYMLLFGSVYDTKRGKWKKLVERISEVRPIDPAVIDVIMAFHDNFRNSEFHKYSRVRGFVSKDHWTHLHEECTTIKQFVDACIEELIAAPRNIYKQGQYD